MMHHYYEKEDFIDEFVITLDNVKKYQGIDIINPETYFDD